MAIKKISVANFTVFENIDIEFCDGINVFIGENGTGKTHLLKILYATSKFEFVDAETVERKHMDDLFNARPFFVFSEDSLTDFFNISVDTQLCRNPNCDVPYSIGVKEDKYDFAFKSSDVVYVKKIEDNVCTFIPAKEMLAHSGLEKDYLERHLPFDITLIEILIKAGVSTLKNLPDDMVVIMEKIAQIVGGTIVFENNRYYIKRQNGTIIDFSMEAEGFKKLGLIYRLIETGNISKGSVLIWDEPESNLNPKLIPDLIDIILMLEEAGVQMFFATHDYFFAKFLEVRKTKKHKVLYHALFNNENGVSCESQEDFDNLENNSIIAQSIALYKEEVKKVME